MKTETIAKVYLWDSYVGALAWDEATQIGFFEYDPAFAKMGWEIAPLHMPVKPGVIYEFPQLSRDCFHGLPACMADSLPDDYGNALINAWLARHNRDSASFSPLERLLYTASRGMGALEYRPALDAEPGESVSIQLDSLVELAGEVLSNREAFADRFRDSHDGEPEDDAMKRLIQLGTSAGGARAKAVIAMNDKGEIRSGQVRAPKGFTYWLLKFDVASNSANLADTQGFGRAEYAYYLMARAAGIDMTECRLREEGGRAHFMTQRFDRTSDGDKLHVQTLCAMAHANYKVPGGYSYEEAFDVLRKLKVPRADAEQLYRRMVFNVVARNQDDHVKNIAMLMGQDGKWRITPAYDVAWAYREDSPWVNSHQMTLAGKRDGFLRSDLLQVGRKIANFDAEKVLAEVIVAVKGWREFARLAGVDSHLVETIAETHRLAIA